MSAHLPAFAAYTGSTTPRLVLVGEAWGESEAQTRQPFAGSSGRELWRMMVEGGILPIEALPISDDRFGPGWIGPRRQWLEDCKIGMTSVLALQPPGNDVRQLCASRKEVGQGYTHGHLAQGLYLRSEFLPELARLQTELETLRPNLVVALGNTACWALLQATNIGSIRGTVTWASALAPAGTKVLPTYSPSAVLRQWSWRPIVIADLIKAQREAETRELIRPERRVLINPTLGELQNWTDTIMTLKPDLLAADIETGAGQIKCISFAPSPRAAIVVPFVDQHSPDYSYWRSPGAECAAWEMVKIVLESDIPKLGQNFLYDLQYITKMGILPRNCLEDTMLRHHALYPELQKGLGFLGSIYTNEASWKLMRRPRPDTEKRDE